MKTLILGGIKSGKSKLAEQLAESSNLPVTYIATATAGDEEMQARITHHQSHRPKHWVTAEAPVALAATLHEFAAADKCLLVDCLTLWLSNLLQENNENLLTLQRQQFIHTLAQAPGEIILVSNETSMGIIPLGQLTRRYCDEAGLLHQELASMCDRVILTVAGLPLVLKGEIV